MSEQLKTCPRCGTAIQAEAPQGLCPKCLLAAVSMPTEAGTSGGGKFILPTIAEIAPAFPQLEILKFIGQGGMGVVFKARQPKLDRIVALKILPQSLAADAAFAERFTREGRVLARLNHPNIVTVHDFGHANGFFYLLMEYVDGANLRQAMQAGRFTPDQALAVVPKVCEALQYAHNEGILHRDIKPENILLDAKGRVKIADFGIAKLVGEPLAEKSLTASGARLGTPHYMAPEQIEKPSEVDHRADVYSLGVVFYEMLTGELPLGRFARPSEKSSSDPRLDEVVFRTLEKEPARRTQSANEVKTQVENATNAPPSLKYDTGSLPGEWQIRCATCGTAKPFSVAGRISLGAASMGQRKLVRCSTCGGLREGIVERAGASPIGSLAPPMDRPVLKIGPSYITTPEHLATFAGQINLYRGRGELRLSDTRLTFIHQWHSVTIPLASIRDLSIGHFSWTMKPSRLDFLCITFLENGQTRRLLFTPHESRWMPTWSTNEVVAEWFTAVRDAVVEYTGQVPTSTPAAQLAIPEPAGWMRMALAALVIVPILLVVAVPLGVIFNGRADRSLVQLFVPLTVALMSTLGFFVALGWISRHNRKQAAHAGMPSTPSTPPRSSGFFPALAILAFLALSIGIVVMAINQSKPNEPLLPAPGVIGEPTPNVQPPSRFPSLTRLKDDVVLAKKEYLTLKTKYEALLKRQSGIDRGQAILSIEFDESLARLNTQYAMATQDRSNKEQYVGTQSPDYQRAASVADEIRKQLEIRTQAIMDRLKIRMDSAERNLALLEAELARRKQAQGQDGTNQIPPLIPLDGSEKETTKTRSALAEAMRLKAEQDLRKTNSRSRP